MIISITVMDVDVVETHKQHRITIENGDFPRQYDTRLLIKYLCQITSIVTIFTYSEYSILSCVTPATPDLMHIGSTFESESEATFISILPL